jgi:hypothetical protein
MTPLALQVQEICDYVCDFLHDSRTDLYACSLISHIFISSAQHHIFCEIDLTGPEGETLGRARLGSRRLCTVLMESPHLIRFIRRLRIAFERDVLTHLARVQFTHVEASLL